MAASFRCQAPLTMTTSRSLYYRPVVAWFAALSALWVFGVVTLGAFTTSIHAGMAFPDWPLSNGSINPDGWLTEVDKFAEHSHRLFGMVMGLLAIVLVVGLHRYEARGWLRKLGWASLAIVVVQGLLGGTRVLQDSIQVPGFSMSLGEMLRIPHGILAQIYVCSLVAIAVSLSRPWIERGRQTVAPNVAQRESLRRLALMGTLLLFAQLVIAALMRHNNAGLAIPTFPLTPEGGLVPKQWDFRVGIHFAHRAMAVVLTGVLGGLVVALWRAAKAGRGYRLTAGALSGLLGGQILLGAITVWTTRDAYAATAHVILGAILLAMVFTITWWMHRDAFLRTQPASLAK